MTKYWVTKKYELEVTLLGSDSRQIDGLSVSSSSEEEIWLQHRQLTTAPAVKSLDAASSQLYAFYHWGKGSDVTF